MVVVVVGDDRRLDPRDSVVAAERVERPEERAPRFLRGARDEAGREVVAAVDQERGARLGDERVAVGERGAVAEQVLGDRRPRARVQVGEVPRLLEAQVDELLHAGAHRGERLLRVLDGGPVRGQQHVRLAGGEHGAGDMGGSEALHTGIRPLGGRERPQLPVAVDEVAAEGDLPTLHLDEVGHRAGRMAGRGERVDRVAADLNRAVLRDDSRDGHGLEQGEAVLAEVVVVLELPLLPVLGGVLDQVALERRYPDPDPGRGGAGQPLDLVAVMVGDEDVRDALDAEVGEAVEDLAAPEVDEDRLPAAAEHVDVARIAVESDPGDRPGCCRRQVHAVPDPMPLPRDVATIASFPRKP